MLLMQRSCLLNKAVERAVSSQATAAFVLELDNFRPLHVNPIRRCHFIKCLVPRVYGLGDSHDELLVVYFYIVNIVRRAICDKG